jgi:hypothetical protein
MTDPSTVTHSTISWTREKLKRLVAAHAEAVRTSKTEFTFEGNEFVTSYAKYLIEYLKGVFR